MSLSNKTEPATGRKREDTRNEGRVAKSMDVNSVVVLLVCLVMLKVAGPWVMQGLSSMIHDTLANLHSQPVSVETLSSLAAQYGIRMAVLCLPFAAVAGAAGLVANVAQVGLRITTKQMQPNLNKLNPIQGVARFFSPRILVELLKSILKLGAVGYIAYTRVKSEFPRMADLSSLPPGEAGAMVVQICWRLAITAWLVMLVIAILDYVYQRFAFERSIMMTKQEVKDEYKRTEGDPKIKSKIRQRQFDLVRSRMIHAIPTADVVITNPTHIAVAVKYDAAQMAAPVVVAKGQRLLAEKIKSIAAANGVPVVENVPVARLLYKLVEVGSPIPEQLYQAVAEILAFVYRLNDKAGRGRRAG